MENELEEDVQTTTELSVPIASGAIETALLTQASLEAAQKMVKLLPAFRACLIQATNPEDWVLLGDKMYPQDAAAKKIAMLASVDIKARGDVQMQHYTDDRGPVIMFTAKVAAVSRNGRVTEEEGSASTTDQFWNGTEEVQEGEKTVKKVRRLPLSEIPIPRVRGKALTNAQGRAARKHLGLFFSPEEVASAFKAAGRDVSKLGAVSYGGKSGEKNATTGRGETSTTKKAIREMILELVDPPQDKNKAGDFLEHLTENKEKGFKGKRVVDDMSDKQAEWVYKRVKEAFEKMQAEQAGQGGAK